ncbi:hypothetical protein RB653_002019 [Dictyostelium firmibasis]|uniref:THO complex subunit 7 homolog n=1 Tax=Dictyostelium firmibasis TaxID=79012 RepID=A0AAN7YPN7_9MYCE
MEDEEESIIRNRIVYKDFVIKKVFKKYLQFINATTGNSEESSADLQSLCTQLINEFGHLELSVQKAQTISETCSDETLYYQQLSKQREIEIENEKKEIAILKETLDYEKKQRQYKEQYLALYKAINEKPSTEQTEKEIEKSQKELNEITDQTNKTTSKLELRSKQFQLLLHTLNELEKNLDESLPYTENNTTNTDQSNTPMES